MTRKAIFRYMLALKFLWAGDATAYYFLLPKRWKWSLWDMPYDRREMALLMRRVQSRFVARTFEQLPRFMEFVNGDFRMAPISDANFRLPFQVQ
jgi:hypothetical protein